MKNTQSTIDDIVSDESAMWGGSRATLLAGSDEWFRQYGILNSYVINNLIVYLLSCRLGIKDIEIQVDPNNSKMNFNIYLGFWRYHFRRDRIASILGKILLKQLPTYEIDIFIKRFAGTHGQAIK